MKQTDKLIVRTENSAEQCSVYLAGELDLESAAHMRAVIAPLVEQSDRKLILNLRDLKYVDSTGIGIIVSMLKARRANNGLFAVEAIPSNIRRLFDMTGILPFLVGQAEHP